MYFMAKLYAFSTILKHIYIHIDPIVIHYNKYDGTEDALNPMVS
jgi:hypothetical protein